MHDSLAGTRRVQATVPVLAIPGHARVCDSGRTVTTWLVVWLLKRSEPLLVCLGQSVCLYADGEWMMQDLHGLQL
jgi:hypothetical protein